MTTFRDTARQLVMSYQCEAVAATGVEMMKMINTAGGTKNGCRITTINDDILKSAGVKARQTGVYDVKTFGITFRVYYVFNNRPHQKSTHTAYVIGVYGEDGKLDCGLFDDEHAVRAEIRAMEIAAFTKHIGLLA